MRLVLYVIVTFSVLTSRTVARSSRNEESREEQPRHVERNPQPEIDRDETRKGDRRQDRSEEDRGRQDERRREDNHRSREDDLTNFHSFPPMSPFAQEIERINRAEEAVMGEYLFANAFVNETLSVFPSALFVNFALWVLHKIMIRLRDR